MTVADRYEGESAGTCGCGSALVWTRDGGEWHVAHADAAMAVACSALELDTPSDVDEQVAI